MVLLSNVLYFVGVGLAKIFCFYWNSPQAYVLYSGYQIIESTCDIHKRLKSPPPHPPLQSYSVSGHFSEGSLKKRSLVTCHKVVHSDSKLQNTHSIHFINLKKKVILISEMNVCRRVSATTLTFSSQKMSLKHPRSTSQLYLCVYFWTESIVLVCLSVSEDHSLSVIWLV